MAIFGSFVYGQSVTYGPSTLVVPFGTLYMLRDTVIEVTFNTPILRTPGLTEPTNYTIEFYDTPGSTDVAVRRILTGTRNNYTTTVYIVTSEHTKGRRYRLSIEGITNTSGEELSLVMTGTGARTKTDDLFSNIPEHFDKRQESRISAILSAIGKQDDLIGGTRREPV